MRSPFGVIIFISLILLLDTYFFQAIKTITQSYSHRYKNAVHTLYWLTTLITILTFLFFIYIEQDFFSKAAKAYMLAFLIGIFLAKLIGITFVLVDDVRRLVQFSIAKMIPKANAMPSATADGDGISRSVFLSWLGIAAGSTLFGSLLYGFNNKYNYMIKNVQLSFENLPPAFRGLKIVHISDIHSGSFTNPKGVAKGIEMILAQKPDLILFTGDLVNDRAIEMDPYKDMMSRINAPMGVYSVLGNHDYGDYAIWPHKGVTKEQNLVNLKQLHSDMGWRLLMNEHVVLDKGGEKIALLGIENWSAKSRFPKHGKLNKAYQGASSYPFKILMSHDPSHWDAEVKQQYNDINLMLSGHTHGMQFGVDIPGFKWSPVQYIYKQWAGLYEEANQKLYVNRGFGFIGYPGRVGVLPEITLIELV
ncbi:MAG: metallophosphoesterase [Ferruginibacter sp.]